MSEHLYELTAAMLGTGGIYTHCVCGRDHYAIDADYITDEEKANALKAHRDNINGTILTHDVDAIMSYSFGNIGPMVVGCPCKKLETLEDQLWGQRETIRRFFTNRVARMVAEGEANAVMNHPVMNPPDTAAQAGQVAKQAASAPLVRTLLAQWGDRQ